MSPPAGGSSLTTSPADPPHSSATFYPIPTARHPPRSAAGEGEREGGGRRKGGREEGGGREGGRREEGGREKGREGGICYHINILQHVHVHVHVHYMYVYTVLMSVCTCTCTCT